MTDLVTALRDALIAKLSDTMDPDGAAAMVRRFEDALIAAHGRAPAEELSSDRDRAMARPLPD